MGFNNPNMTWWELEAALSDRTPEGRGRDGRPPASPAWNAGGDGPAWSRKRQPYEAPDGDLTKPLLRPDSPAVPYAELHCHTNFSFLDGASHPEQLAEEAARLGLRALAVTDHDGLYGVVRFAQAAKAVGLPTVFGAELHLPAPDGRRHPREAPGTPGPPVLDLPTGIPDPRASHLLVLARGPDGYRALSRAIAEGHLRTGRKGAADYRLEDLAATAAGQGLVLTGCRKGSVRRALSGGDPSGVAGVSPTGMDAARVELDRLVGLF